MMKKFFAVATLTFSMGMLSFAQNPVINYDFGDKEASFNPNPGASSTSFLPKITLNKAIRVRVRTASDGSGAFHLVKKGADFIKGAGLEVVAGTSTSKFSIYNLPVQNVEKISFNVKFDDATVGQWVFANGLSGNSDDVFQGNSSVKETSTEVFAGLRWTLSATDEINLYTRNGVKWSTVKGVSFAKNAEYLIEIYSNNSTEAKKYTKDGEQTLSVGTYHVWINGKRIIKDFTSAGLEADKNLNGFVLYGVMPKGSESMVKAWFDNLEINGNL